MSIAEWRAWDDAEGKCKRKAGDNTAWSSDGPAGLFHVTETSNNRKNKDGSPCPPNPFWKVADKNGQCCMVVISHFVDKEKAKELAIAVAQQLAEGKVKRDEAKQYRDSLAKAAEWRQHLSEAGKKAKARVTLFSC